ncbi:MAG: hypothetical protein HUU08_05750 [Candidatus Brocadia sp.]|nr:hypothetical protein [Candidatus Brocadia sp.]
MHSRFFVNLVNLVGWASPTKHLVHVAGLLVGDAHPTPYGKARLAATILYDIPSYTARSFFYKKLGIHPSAPNTVYHRNQDVNTGGIVMPYHATYGFVIRIYHHPFTT